MNVDDGIIRMILDYFPATQAVYLFGAYGTDDEWPDSDVDIALLLPPDETKRTGFIDIRPARVALERLLGKDVDLINLRLVSTVFQKEIISADRQRFVLDGICLSYLEQVPP